jgi:hypothetical protein
MEITIKTKYNVGDVVYIADHYYDFYAYRKPYIIKDVLIDVNSRRTYIQYEVEQDGTTYRSPEHWTFTTYEECAKWCEEHN